MNNIINTDSWIINGVELGSRLMMGTARFSSPDLLARAFSASRAEILTMSVRRNLSVAVPSPYWDLIRQTGALLLPNTAGCLSAGEAVTVAHMARELFETNWIKLEVIGNDFMLHPDSFGLVSAARQLISDGFFVFPYMTEDLVLAQRLIDVGCELLMPWGAPIGSGRGLVNPYGLRLLRSNFPKIPMIVDAGMGRPSDAVQAMEMGFDGILLNTAISDAIDPVLMASAFCGAIQSGRQAFLAGIMEKRDSAVPSTPVFGRPFSYPDSSSLSNDRNLCE